MTGDAVSAREVLAEDEIALLRRSLSEWSGPARCSDQLAVAMGFASFQDLLAQCRRLRDALGDDAPLSAADWARTLLASEIAFVSDLAGSGVDWQTTTGRSDEATIRALRSIQRKLAKVVGAYYGRSPDLVPSVPRAAATEDGLHGT